MRFCVSCRHNKKTRDKAQELKVEARDIAFLDDYICQEEKPHTIVLEYDGEIKWEKLVMYNECLKGNFMLSVRTLGAGLVAKEKGIKFYWNNPVVTMYELNSVIAAGASQVILGPPLVFDKAAIEALGVKVRLIPNYSFNDYIIDDGVCGGWVRPEGLSTWEDIAESCEFISTDLQNERAIFDIYIDRKWPDDLSLLITGLNKKFNAKYITEEFDKHRASCKQRCQRNKNICQYCYRICKMSEVLELRDNLQNKNKEI